MKNVIIPKLYKQYFIDKQDERMMLFQKVNDLFHPHNGLYPGSFVHITPSFFIRDMTYVDNDKRISKFFDSDNLMDFIESKKTYPDKPLVNGIQADFSKDLPLIESSFAILFSFYAGFVSQDCKTFLKPLGILITNNSHGDASLAHIDEDYELIGVVKRIGNKFNISDKTLEDYFQKKDGSSINKSKVVSRMIGENFTKKAYAYIFQFKSL